MGVKSVHICLSAILAVLLLSVFNAPLLADEATEAALPESPPILDRTKPLPTILEFIERLEKESLEDSLENLDHVEDFHFPGYLSGDGTHRPFDDVHVILSNRRFAKVLDGLAKADPEKRYAPLEAHLKRLLAKYRDAIAEFKFINNPVSPDWAVFLGLSEDGQGRPRARGIRPALRALALISGILGEARVWPLIRESFRHPLCGFEIDEEEYIEGARKEMHWNPVFATGFQAGVVYLFATHLDDAAAAVVGFSKPEVARVVADFKTTQALKQAIEENLVRKRYGYDVTRKVVIPNYQARSTYYDPGLGSEPDLSYGFREVEFLVTDDKEFLAEVVKAAGL